MFSKVRNLNIVDGKGPRGHIGISTRLNREAEVFEDTEGIKNRDISRGGRSKGRLSRSRVQKAASDMWRNLGRKKKLTD